MSIQDIVLKIKGRGAILMQSPYLARGIWFLAALAACVVCFFCGRILAYSGHPAVPISIVYPPLVSIDGPKYQEGKLPTAISNPKTSVPKAVSAQTTREFAFVGSSAGKTYYPKDCRGYLRIKEGNRVYFTTREEAVRTGRTLAKACTK